LLILCDKHLIYIHNLLFLFKLIFKLDQFDGNKVDFEE
jgi:hypothetical protein